MEVSIQSLSLNTSDTSAGVKVLKCDFHYKGNICQQVQVLGCPPPFFISQIIFKSDPHKLCYFFHVYQNHSQIWAVSIPFYSLCWMQFNWGFKFLVCSGQIENFVLPAEDCISPGIVELMRIPDCTHIVVGHDGFGEFSLWYVFLKLLGKWILDNFILCKFD